jgi:hypothetical protein
LVSDVGDAPCRVTVSGKHAIGSTVVDKIPADQIHLNAETSREPQR